MLATWLYRNVLRPGLFLLDPEDAHDMVGNLLPASAPLLSIGKDAIFSDKVLSALPRLCVNLANTTLTSPVGLAAGLDKNAKFVALWPQFGFGFTEIGSVTAEPSLGNERPRLFRLPEDQAIINRMGLNGDGAKAVAQRLAAIGQSQNLGPVALNIAKSNLPGLHGQLAVNDLLSTFQRFQGSDLAYVTINTSCPNTHDGALAEISEFREILKAIDAANQSNFPLFLKLSPDSSDEFIAMIFASIEALDIEIAGFVCGNTSVSRENLQTPVQRLASIGRGGLSGLPLKERMLAQVTKLNKLKAPQQQIIACGGIASAADVVAAMAAGASAVQLYTALVYHGPFVVMEILADLALGLARANATVTDLVANEKLAAKIL
ncbi:MAG: quinone-dependent dihydroorotate dehydrogenase [Candidatus Obscuribacterales bacterium]